MVNHRQRQQASWKGSCWNPSLAACLLPLLAAMSAGNARADIQAGRTAARALSSTERPKGPVVITPTRRDPLPGG